MAKTAHNPWFIALVIFNVFTLVTTIVISALSGFTGDNGMFVSTQRKQSDKYNVDITPATWTFTIWGVIYAWQILWLVYSVANLFRVNCFNEPLYASPYVLPPLLYGLYSVANGCSVAWCFLYDRDFMAASFAVLLLNALLLVLGLVVSYRVVDKTWEVCSDQGRDYEVWLVRGLVHNGVAIYATWTSVASVISLAIVIAYSEGSDVTVPTASTIALVVLSVELSVFAISDLYLLDRFSRYTLTPYFALLMALVGVLTKNWAPDSPNSLFVAILLGVVVFVSCLKLILTLVRHMQEKKVVSQNVT